MPSSQNILSLGDARAAARGVPVGARSDEELMAAFSASLEERCFEELARRYGEKAWHVAAALVGAGPAAEDAVQEAFLRVVRSASTYRRGESFRNWFFAVLRNVCRDELRRPAPGRASEEEAAAAIAGSDPAAAASRREEAAAAWRALSALPGHEREVLALRFYGGLDFPEIARACGISTVAARQRASRGLSSLRRLLGWKPVTPCGPVRNPDEEPDGREG